MSILIRTVSLCVLFSLALFTGRGVTAPIIAIDSPNVNLGLIREGSVEKIEHLFKIRNEGDEPLIITRIRAGCGCTVVEYDSLIPPGYIGRLNKQLILSKVSNGPFTKSVQIYSNAKNSEMIRVSLSGTIVSDINLSNRFVHMKQDSTGTFVFSMTMSTEKKDFKINSITFEAKKEKEEPLWQQNNETAINYALTSAGAPDSHGFYTFALTMTCAISAPKEMVQGTFKIETNHPRRPSIDLRGMFNPE